MRFEAYALYVPPTLNRGLPGPGHGHRGRREGPIATPRARFRDKLLST